MSETITQLASFINSRTRIILRLKVLLSIAVIMLLSAVIIWPMTNPVGKALKLSFTSIKKNESGGSSMINPSFHGIDKNNQPFRIEASEAVQEDNNNVILKKIKGDLALKDGTWVYLSADKGSVDISKKKALLKEDVHLLSDTGYEFVTSSAEIDFREAVASGNEDVTLYGLPGVLKATGFEVLESGQKFIFHGRVELVIFKKNKKRK